MRDATCRSTGSLHIGAQAKPARPDGRRRTRRLEGLTNQGGRLVPIRGMEVRATRVSFPPSVQKCSTGQVDAALPSRGTNEPFWIVHDLDILDKPRRVDLVTAALTASRSGIR
jgi:hypothetical protein